MPRFTVRHERNVSINGFLAASPEGTCAIDFRVCVRRPGGLLQPGGRIHTTEITTLKFCAISVKYAVLTDC